MTRIKSHPSICTFQLLCVYEGETNRWGTDVSSWTPINPEKELLFTLYSLSHAIILWWRPIREYSLPHRNPARVAGRCAVGLRLQIKQSTAPTASFLGCLPMPQVLIKECCWSLPTLTWLEFETKVTLDSVYQYLKKKKEKKNTKSKPHPYLLTLLWLFLNRNNLGDTKVQEIKAKYVGSIQKCIIPKQASVVTQATHQVLLIVLKWWWW